MQLQTRSRKPMVILGLFLACMVFATMLLASSSPARAQASIVYVNANATSVRDGQTWGTAYPYLQDALDEANASGSSDFEIWVAQGIYYPDLDSDGDHASNVVTETFRIRYSNVQLYGGFTGIETARSQRNWTANVTVLSGDIDQNDTTNAEGVVEDTGDISGSNAYHVLYLDGVTHEPITSTTVIDGFSITAGHAHGDSAVDNDDAGGMYCLGQGDGKECSPTLANITFSGNLAVGSGGAIRNNGYLDGKSCPVLTHVTFTHNAAASGGAMYNSGNARGDGSPVLNHVTFANNASSGSGGAMYNNGYYSGRSSPVLTHVTFTDNAAGGNGGAMMNNGDQGNSNPVLTSVTFTGNSASGSQYGSKGGAMYNYGDNGNSNPTLTHVTFDSNSADTGGAMYNHAWEAAGDSNPVLTDVTFSNNTAVSGGALYNGSTYDSRTNPKLTNVRFYSNSASSNGGAMVNYGYHGHSNAVLVNVLFSGNSAYRGGAMYSNGDHGNAAPALTNVTLNGNSATYGGALYTTSYAGEGDPSLRNAILWGNTADNGPQIYIAEYASTSVTYSIIEGGWTGTGNLDIDPQFMDAPTGDLHLQPTSPAIDAGNNEVVPVSVTTDLDGYPRFVDYPPEGGSGYGTSPFVDMGAYEAQIGFDLFLPLVGK